MKKKYIFSSIFTYENDGISIEFPDLPGCISCGFTTDEALKMAKEALELYTNGMKEEEIPKARQESDFKINKANQKIFSFEVEI
ncbi:Predicted nuclease of the RNAse H fold, HicB family [Clostridium cavendishii DSM 21758]|uniref:Predicted nuclease of the RNAse H fold, HicB family n=1 Tax=Clostridium cavendishii DSM 21758 TaxID=1121302 RepID=A0A1M6RJI7_9CLOT|nr:type II toxin-antitoxin system HicB family antitoxin [Clostridium cavendishii]SHK32671.1 Predicted nuclease of the RNAse H fold, HicB family [Clostridium cavendishii DSM 21758]